MPQNENEATYCKKITKEEGLLDFRKTAEELYHLSQGLTPWPGIYTDYKGKKLIIEKCSYLELPPVYDHPPQPRGEERSEGGSSREPIGTVIRH